jgi:PAT family beta-lactamase induction signal transducer AmpG
LAVAAASSGPRLREVLADPKMLAIMGLGAASGFPNQISDSTLQAWLKDSGATNTAIGILSYVALPYLLKFLWAPLLDRYPVPLLGRRRGWMLVIQLAMAAAILLLALQSPSNGLTLIALCALLIVFFSASQDIVIDAWRTDVTLPHERGLAAAANNLGYRAAAWFAFAFALVVADAFGWRPAFLLLAVGIAAFAIVSALAPEPDYKQAPPRSLAESVALPLKALFGSPGMIAMIALIMLFKIGDAFALRLFTPFMMDTGFSLTEIGLVSKAMITTGTIAGAILGGIWMVKLGLLRSMLFFGVLQTVANLGYYLLAVVGKDFPLMVTVVGIDNLASGMGNVASVALIMAMCQARFSAFQYALLSALALVPRYGLGGPAGVLADTAGWETYYVVSFLIGLPGLAIVWWMRDRVRALDTKRD